MRALPHQLIRLAPIFSILLGASSAGAAKIACVGDSITFGYGLSDPEVQSYPAILQGLLGSEHEVGNFGVSGATLLESGDRPYRDESRFQDSNSFAPDIVIVMLGTNDAKPINWSGSEQFTGDYQSLVEHYRGQGAVVYLATPPTVFGAGAFEISPAVVAGEVVPTVRDLAAVLEAPLIDAFDATQSSSSFFPDTVHPGAEGARLLADTVFASLTLHDFEGPDEMAAGTGGAAPFTGGTGGLDGSGGSGGSSTGGSPDEGQAGGAPPVTGGASTGGSIVTEPETESGGVSSGGASSGVVGAGGLRTSDPPENEAESAPGCQMGGKGSRSWALLALSVWILLARRREQSVL